MVTRAMWIPKIVLPFLMLLGGCSAQKIRINTTEKSTISLIDAKSLKDTGEVIGSSPAEVEVDKINGRFIKVTADGKLPQYIIVTDALGVQTDAFVTLESAPEPEEKEREDDSRKDRDDKEEDRPKPSSDSEKDDESKKPQGPSNLSFRLLLRSYQALTVKKYDESIQLADKLAEVEGQIAAPHIIKGLAQMGKGDRQQANSSFQQAKALDPSDTDIDKLIQATK